MRYCKKCLKWLLGIALCSICLFAGFIFLLGLDDAPTSRDVSLNPRYSQIYQKSFKVQKELFLCESKWDGEIFLDTKVHECQDWGFTFATIEAGTMLWVKQILLNTHSKGKYLEILVGTDDPRFAAQRINGIELILHWQNLIGSQQMAEFNPKYFL